MKASIALFIFLCSAITSLGQSPFSTDEALKQLYHDYDPATKTAQWVCTKEQLREGLHTGWQCWKEDTTVSVSVILMAQVPEGDATRVYLATSAKPAHDPMGEYNCHGCAPAIGAAVFVWKSQGWALESANAAIDFLGGWGEPPSVDLVAVGSEKHGLVLSSDDEGQGFSSSFKELLIPLGKGIENVWGIEDESDDVGAIDPDDKANSPPLYHSSAAIRFFAAEDVNEDNGGYYDIEVISRGTSWQGWNHPVRPENWTEIFTFKDGKYRLSHRTMFSEVKKPRKAANR